MTPLVGQVLLQHLTHLGRRILMLHRPAVRCVGIIFVSAHRLDDGFVPEQVGHRERGEVRVPRMIVAK
jgi:hypothetical protein